MTTAMGPPPPRIPTTANSNTTTTSNTELQPETLDDEPSPAPSVPAPMNTAPMGPPAAPVNPNPSITDANQPKLDSDPQSFEVDHGKNSTTEPNDVNSIDKQEKSQNVGVPYTIPPWSEAPRYQYSFEVLKDGSIVDQFYVYEKGAYMFGRVDLCDFVLEHPTISRFHAVLQFNKNGDAFLYDLSSTHGTFVNKNQVKKKVYVELHVGDVIRFGHSSRLYIFQGPTELMPPEKDLTNTRKVKIREGMEDMEASLRRAELEASMADGISWGMDEDAIEENEDEIDEITWQTYKGQLTEKQEKTRDKVLKRLEKVANMKKEIDAIRVKDISQGGLTQGQQTQIARNEQRILQIVEELENLEETLNESIRESLGARSGRPTRGKKKGATEDDEDDYMSDDDEFYDRAKKKMPKQKGSENQSIETAGSLLDKKDVIIKEMEDKKKLLLDEKGKTVPENEPVAEAGDALDAYMSGLSTQLVLDKTEQLQKELDTLQSELDRILYLLKIADPTGEATRKRESKPESSKPEMSKTTAPTVVKKSAPEQHKRCGAEETVSGSVQNQGVIISNVESGKRPKECEIVADAGESRTAVYTDVKPQRLGAIEDREVKQQIREETLQKNNQEGDQFVDYKDWKKVLGKLDADLDLGIANAPPGLLIRKRKLPEKSDVTEVKASEQSTSSSEGEEFKAEDAVALLLKHTRGYHASDDEVKRDNEDMAQGNQLKKGVKKPKKVLGPERPSFLGNEGSYDESWVPPQGQSGDGRTSLNERYGY